MAQELEPTHCHSRVMSLTGLHLGLGVLDCRRQGLDEDGGVSARPLHHLSALGDDGHWHAGHLTRHRGRSRGKQIN